MKKVILFSILSIIFVLTSCKKEQKTEEVKETKKVEEKTDVKTEVKVEEKKEEVKEEVKVEEKKAPKGSIPFEFPLQEKLNAQNGDLVLCPPLLWIEDAFKKGGDNQTFIYYGAYVQESGSLTSKVKGLAGTEMEIPNSMIVPIKKGQKAKPGDIILTHWQSGSGMQRAIVIEGGTEEEPMIRYLDLDYDNPAGVGQKDDKCKKDTFHVMKDDFELGSSIAVKDGSSYKHYQVLNIIDNKILALGFAGRVSVVDKANAIAIPVKYVPKVKENVFVVAIGSFRPGVVTKLDTKIGRVFVEYEFGGQKQTTAFPFGQIISKLP